MAELDAWASDHEEFLRAVCDEFFAGGEWPIASKLTHTLFVAGGV